MPDLHIIPSGDRWEAKEENGDVVGTYDTQADAERPARSGSVHTAAERSSRTAMRESFPEFVRATRSSFATSWRVQSRPRPGRVTVAGATAARLALRAALVLGCIVEYPNSECGFEQRLAARDHAHRVHDVAAFDLFEHVAGRAGQD